MSIREKIIVFGAVAWIVGTASSSLITNNFENLDSLPAFFMSMIAIAGAFCAGVAILFSIVSGIISMAKEIISKEPFPEVGETWYWVDKSGSPWPKESYPVIVDGVSNGWVMYSFVRYPDYRPCTMSIDSFRHIFTRG